jgi:hypothetical protein
MVGRVRAVYPYKHIALYKRFDSAADAAYGADGSYLLAIGTFPLIGAFLGEYGARRTSLETSAAGYTGGFAQRLIKVGYYHIFPAAVSEIQRVNAYNLVARPYASATKDAPVSVDNQIFMLRVNRQRRPGIRVARIIHLISITKLLQFTIAAGYTLSTKMVAFGKHKLQDQAAMFLQFFVLCLYYQAVPGRVGAGRNGPSLSFDIDDAHAAGADVRQSL